MKTFILIWFGQLVSLLGTHLTGFALGVWVYQQTGSVTRFALISACTMLPGLLISPVAGALVDRWDRRLAMILSDFGAGVSTLIIVILLLSDNLALRHIYFAIAVSSIFNALQWPAYSAAITLLVPKSQLGRASGMSQTSEAVARIVSPFLGGILLSLIHIWGVILIDLATFLFALCTLLLVRIPRPQQASHQTPNTRLIDEINYGWRYITTRPGLLRLLGFFAVINFMSGIGITLITPLVLSFASEIVLGMVMSLGGLGMLLGSILMTTWGGPRRRIRAIQGLTFLQGMVFFLGGLQPNAALIAVAAFIFLFALPIIFGCSQVIWQCKVATEVQGRVFAFRRMIALSSWPLAMLVAGPLADYIFTPLLEKEGLLAGTLGRIIGVGPGRGIGFLFILLGVIIVSIAFLSFFSPRLRLLEDELPDMLHKIHAP